MGPTNVVIAVLLGIAPEGFFTLLGMKARVVGILEAIVPASRVCNLNSAL